MRRTLTSWPPASLMSGQSRTSLKLFQSNFVTVFRATIDQDEDGDISKEEFIKNSMNSPFIAEVLKERKKRV